MRASIRFFGYRLICLVFLLNVLSACAPAQPVTIVYHTLTPVNDLTPSPTPTKYKPVWDVLTKTPGALLPTRTPYPTRTPAPPTATPIPNPQLDTYMPGMADLPMCLSLSYNIGINSASLNCGLKTYGSFSISLNPSSALYNKDALLIPANYFAVEVPVIGTASSAGKNDTEDNLILQFYKKRVKVTINYSTPRIPVKVDDVVAIAQIMEQKIPEVINLPTSLTFPDTPHLENVKNYFTEIKLLIYSKSTFFSSPEYPRNAQVCVYVAPAKTEREKFWTVVFYNQQTEKIERKMMYGMVANRICGGLEPSYTPKNPFTAGDQYEVRIAVNDEWVATFPYVTK